MAITIFTKRAKEIIRRTVKIIQSGIELMGSQATNRSDYCLQIKTHIDGLEVRGQRSDVRIISSGSPGREPQSPELCPGLL